MLTSTPPKATAVSQSDMQTVWMIVWPSRRQSCYATTYPNSDRLDLETATKQAMVSTRATRLIPTVRAAIERAIAPEQSQVDPRDVIRNLACSDNQPLNWFVSVYAIKYRVQEYQCRTPEDAQEIARAVRAQRAKDKMPTGRITRKQLLGGSGRRKEFGPEIEIDVERVG